MKRCPLTRSRHRTVLTLLAIAFLLTFLNSCSRYNPYTGQYEVDPGRTMAAVGTAAFAASIAHDHHEYSHHHNDYYRRPPGHAHYHRY